jgi:hypothetical protein
MHDKIKELAKEAGYYLYDLTETHECKTVETDSKDEWITLAKFAELIVRECASMARVFQSNEYDFTGDLDLDEFMLKHFGVEE